MSGRRVTVVAGAGGWAVSAGSFPLLTGARIIAAAPSTAWIGSGIVGRSLAAPGRTLAECWLADLDLPAALWEASGDAGPITLAWAMSGPPASLAISDDRTRLRAGATPGPLVDLSVTGGSLSVERDGADRRIVCRGTVPVRMLVAGGVDETDHARTLQRLARAPGRLAEAWRGFDRSATRLETPDPILDRAFTWAWRRLGGRMEPAGPGDSAAARATEDLWAAAARFLADPAALDPGLAEAVLGGALAGLWGIAPGGSQEAVTLRPQLPAEWSTMGLRRLRVGRSLLDVELRRRRGDLVARVRRIYGPRPVVSLEPDGGPFGMAVVDEVELPGGRARFEAADRHVIVFRGDPA